MVAYLVDVWGWENFLDFYFNLEQGQSPSDTINAALENKSGMDLDQLEDELLTYLRTLEPEDRLISDVRLTIEVYDMIRRYQSLLIPSAHYKSAWWPPIDRMLDMGITEDYGNREKAPINIIIENNFLKIQEAFEMEAYQEIEARLAQVDKYLEIIERSGNYPSHYSLGWPLPHHPQIINKP